MSEHLSNSLPLAEAVINPLPNFGIWVPAPKVQKPHLKVFTYFPMLPTELQDKIWLEAISQETVVAPQRVIVDGKVIFTITPSWCFLGTDPNIIKDVCFNSRLVMLKHCKKYHVRRDAKVAYRGPVMYANSEKTMFVLGDFQIEHDSFHPESIAKMEYITIEGRDQSSVWVRDPYNLTPGSICLDLELLASMARNLKAVFVQSKLSHGAGRDPAIIALASPHPLYQHGETVTETDGIRPLNADLFTYLARFVGYQGPNIDDERRCIYFQYRERQWCERAFTEHEAFAAGAPAIHFLPLYTPYRETFRDANQDRCADPACHHEIVPRAEVTDQQAIQICRPPRLAQIQAMLAARQENAAEATPDEPALDQLANSLQAI